MGFRVLVGDPISEGSRLGPDYSSHGERDVRGLDVESYIGLSCGTLRKCGDPSDCISRRRSIVHLSDEPMSCPFPMNCLCSTCRLTLIQGGLSASRSATCKAAEKDCLERRNSIRPCVPSHVAYKAERGGNELFWSPWK